MHLAYNETVEFAASSDQGDSVDPRILVVDDDEQIRLSIDLVLAEQGYKVVHASSPEQAQEVLEGEDVSLVLLDMNYTKDTTSGKEGLDYLARHGPSYPDVPVVVLSAWPDIPIAVAAMRLGAVDFLEKPWDNNRLLQIVRQQLKFVSLQKKNQRMRSQQSASRNTDGLVYRSDKILQLLDDIDRVAGSNASVLLTGENGTGKSTLALRIHEKSTRRDETFVSVSMGAIPTELFESEMFGHIKGAFTGANDNRIGRFEMAQEGTLFLDEISTLNLAQQTKLLRVLETGEYEQLGSSKTRRANVRIISASNADFNKLIREDKFRQDLFFRVNTVQINVPALRERPEDIKPIADHFLTRFGRKYKRETMTLTPDADNALRHYPWPGNIRELSHVIERAVLLSRSNEVTREGLQLDLTPALPAETHEPVPTLEQGERNLIVQAMKHTGGNTQNAADLLGITTSALYRRMAKYRLSAKS